MFRITNRMMYNNTLVNAFRNNQGLLAAQEQISSGKRINRASDDPTGMMEVLALRTRIGKSDQYLKVMGNARSTLDTADTVLGGAHDELKVAKELVVQSANGTSDATTRATTAIRIDTMIDSMIQFGNTRVGGKYIFSGARSSQAAIAANGSYLGSGKDFKLEISKGVELPISAKASEFLTTDMNPKLSATNGVTTLASLNSGTGVPAGTITLTDRAGTSSGALNIGAMTDLQDVISAINAAGTNITASVSTDGTALVLTDSTANPLQALSITDSGAGTAKALGIFGARNSSVFTGNDLNPTITSTTLLADLYGGKGLTLESFTIQNGATSAAVSFTTETTVGAVLSTINTAATTAGMGAAAIIHSNGRMLDFNAATTATVAFATDSATGSMASKLGIGGGQNIIPVLQDLSAALKANDENAILGSITRLNSVMDNTNSIRGAIGARTNQVIITNASEEGSKFDNTRIKSQVEDTDFLAAASELAMLQTAYQSTLKSAASIIQSSLLDFIR